MADYLPQQIEQKWQKQWNDTGAFEVDADPGRPKFYCLEMFAYVGSPGTELEFAL